jgi:hypothetical protein
VREDDGGLQHHAAGSNQSYTEMLSGVLALLEREPPRSFIGWGAVYGFIGRALNFVGRHREAKEKCEHALSKLTAADRPFVTLFLNLELELAAADAALGEVALGRARLDDLLRCHAGSDNPLTRGRIHETYVRLAARSEDWPLFREHLEAMRSWYTRTGTATLLARVERLRVLDPVQSDRPEPRATEHPQGTTRDHKDSLPANMNAGAEVTVCTVTEVTHNDSIPHRGQQTKS